MSTRSHRLISVKHSFSGSPSGLDKDNLCLYVGKCVCDENQSFVNSLAEEMAHWENLGLLMLFETTSQ